MLPAPTRPELFTPDLYPGGPALEPAVGPALRTGRLLADLAAISGDQPSEGPMHWHVDERLAERVPDEHLRAGVAALAATVGAPLVEWLVADDCPVVSLRWGDPGGDRIAGLAQPADQPSHRVVSRRYRYEHPFLATGSVLHQLCWTPGAARQAQEVLLHALLAVAHAQLLAAMPTLVGTTELARRQQSLVLSLLASRPAGGTMVRIIAPDGEGTLPGGAPGMQTADFWSIPFASGVDADQPVEAPLPAALVLEPWIGAVDRSAAPGGPTPLRYDRSLVQAVDDQALDRWLPSSTVTRVLHVLSVG